VQYLFGQQQIDHDKTDERKKHILLTAATQKWRFSGYIKLCAAIKVSACLTVKRFEIATFG